MSGVKQTAESVEQEVIGRQADHEQRPGQQSAAVRVGGCTPPPPPTCGPLSRASEGVEAPQHIQGIGPLDGVAGLSCPQDTLNKNSLYKGSSISPPISPTVKQTGPAKTSESSMAARIQEIALAKSESFTVDEITRDLVKSSSISPKPAAEEEWQPLRKLVSNTLGRMVKKELLERGKGKKDNYRRADLPADTSQGAPSIDDSILEGRQSDNARQNYSWAAFREANRTRPPEEPGQPVLVSWPLEVNQEFRVYPKSLVVVGAVTNGGKTTIALNLALMNMDRHQVTYINSEMSDMELAKKLEDFGRAYSIPWESLYDKVFFAYCDCNALVNNDIKRLVELLDPNGINIIDYIKINDKFFNIGECLGKIHARLDKGIAIVFFQKDPYVDHLLGKSFPEQLARVVMMVDIDRKTGLCRLRFTKVKFPTRKGDRPEKREIWFSIKDGVSLERSSSPTNSNRAKKTDDPISQDGQQQA
jgi:hypothetical protein